jgi:hypothetical protein
MKKTTVFLTLLLSSYLFSCNKSPEACIELESASTSVGKSTTFVSCSENALSYEWFMQGPEGAPENTLGWSDEKFEHVFTVPGSYEITLNAYYKFSFLGEKSTTKATLSVN